MRQRKTIAVVAVAAAGALALSACSSSSGSNSGSSKADGGATATIADFGLGTAADSTGPAPAVAGAKSGGTAYDLEPSGFDYLDPGQVYVSNEMAVSTLYNRTLTGYKTDASGKEILVGDMTTDTGTPSDGGKTWTYHLKSGLKFQDGTTITSADVKYAIERLYEGYQTQGPTYLPTWLSGPNYKKVYTGPASGELPQSVIGTPDASTIVFHFTAVHADAPYAMAMPSSGAIERSKDTGANYNNDIVSDGPYMLASPSDYVPNKSLTLVRNPNWNPSTDPIRNDYPDKWVFELGVQNPGLTTRLEQSVGTDADALSLSTAADSSQSDVILNGAQYKDRTISQYAPYVEYLNINTARVKNVNVRKAIALAFPDASIQKLYGGPSQLQVGSTLISPTVGGWTSADPFNKTQYPNGDPTAAKALLTQANSVGYKLVYAYSNTPRNQTIAVELKLALDAAGFNVVTEPLDTTSYYTLIGTVPNSYDIYRSGWGADWPVASTVVPNLMDGRQIGNGDPDYSQYLSTSTDAQIDAINANPDVASAAKQWNTLAQQIIANDVPQVPFGFDKFLQIYGTGLGGIRYNQVIGAVDANSVYVTNG